MTDERELAALAAEFPGAVWVHGGAAGFDAQVARYAQAHDIPQLVIRPAYDQYGRAAPLIRDRQMVDLADLLVACYDGRPRGGTCYTVSYARRRGVETRLVQPHHREDQLPAPQ
ncbi:MAG: DUF2493 domain-containing protein [Chloroflexi bacterium]|nr:DUF2493 domain-containing protein [Chloroflexota bacterium]